ncbi:hypothetical protein DSO57_1004423 [Entomophthora muscae]|uniref:Uncharacterized protein n=1 Tax=Entomophthora muscae TaxID=34485 RepID=A0ACC2TJT2_9FUNG|nr:hypothetical protein DSO57_1004423 [Entomophthora muscae]
MIGLLAVVIRVVAGQVLSEHDASPDYNVCGAKFPTNATYSGIVSMFRHDLTL